MKRCLLLVWSVLGTTGCASDAGQAIACEGDECSTISSVEEPLIGGWASGPYTVHQSSGFRRKLPNIADNVCVLTRVSGDFADSNEIVQLTDDGTNWYLLASSLTAGVSAEAHCFPRSAFVGGGTRISSEYELPLVVRYACTAVVSTNMYAADAFGFLSGLKGTMGGGGEWVHVDQAQAPDLTSSLQAHLCTSNPGIFGSPDTRFLTGYARSFRVGAHTGRLATFVNRDGNRNDVNSYPEYLIGGKVASAVAVMAPTSDAMCALTTVKGKFAGEGESVQIRAESIRGVEHWVLRTAKGDASDHVEGGARCFARVQ